MRNNQRPTWTSQTATPSGLDSRTKRQLDALKERLNIHVDHDPSPFSKIHKAATKEEEHE